MTETTDSLPSQASPFLVPAWERVCPESAAPTSAADRQGMTMGVVPYTDGVEPEPRQLLPAYDTGVVCLLLCVFGVVSASLAHYNLIVRSFLHDLWSVRQRDNVFDQASTLSETRVRFSLTLLLCVSEGVLLSCAAPLSLAPFTAVAGLSLLALAYYLAQQCAYRVTGWVFAPQPVTARLWVRGFGASQWLLGLALTPLAVLALFLPAGAEGLAWASAVLYVAARLIFIGKGFRLFYGNKRSLFYFILYLCTLEIVPLLVIFRACGFFSITN